ncbi:MAG: type II toxin-antitoxin system RelE/ParE family toxin [Algicola sp.]|nr:type II toxin-antitoxin system RelE/ParE family toxin [Algicola sp.]
MKAVLDQQAEYDLCDAIDQYDKKSMGLGREFALEVRRAIDRAISMPEAWQLLDDKFRRVLVNRFPYGVLYSIEPDLIYIIAVMHLHRDPDYWRDRIS